MALLTKLVLLISSVATFSQVLLYLPLALDIAGKDAMLALSLLLCVQSTIQATTHLLTRNTILRPLSTVLTFVQPFVVPALLLLALNLYSKEASITQVLRGESTPVMNAVWKVLIRAPHWWETILRTSSPLFTILEGLSTLLCIQSFSRFSMNRIEKSRAPDMLQVLFLFGAAVVYVCSAYFLYESFESVPDKISATLVGVAITSVIFLSGISFSINKGNVVETSLMLAYSVFQIFHLSLRPEMYHAGLIRRVLRDTGTNGHPPLPPLVLQSLDAFSSLISHTFGAGVEFLTGAVSALPLPVLVGLFYRVAVLYMASRVILALKRKNEGYEENRRLSDEEPGARIFTLIVTYSRLILIAVYTHLLLLSSSKHQSFWRWINVFLTIVMWGVEMRIGGSTEDERWKSD